MSAMRRTRCDLRRLVQSRCVRAFVLALLIGAVLAHAAPLNATEPVRQHTEDRECEWYWLERYLGWRRTSLWQLRSYPPSFYLPQGMYAHNEALRAWSYLRKCSGDEAEAAEAIATYNDNRTHVAMHFDGRYSLYGRSLREDERDPTYCATCWNPESLAELLAQPDAVIFRGRVVETNPEICSDGTGLCPGDVFTTVAVREVWRGELPQDVQDNLIIVYHSGTLSVNTWRAGDWRRWFEPAEEVVLVLTRWHLLFGPAPAPPHPIYRIVGDRYGYFLLEGDRLRHGVLQDPADPAHRGHPDRVHPLSAFAESVDTSKLKAAFVGGD